MDVRSAIIDASRRREVVAAVEAVYAEVAAEITKRQPVCVISGRCCRFEEYGHRLFVTTMELAAFVASHPQIPEPDLGCPFQVGKLCGVHQIRPFGCRMFYCDPAAQHWQNEVYERFHATLKRLHERFAVPYAYLEWRESLRVLAGHEAPLSRT
jgi:hypothetical protein